MSVSPVDTDQFWRKASDIHDLYRGRYWRAVLTDTEKQATVPAYIDEMMALVGEWYSEKGKGQGSDSNDGKKGKEEKQ